MKFYLDADRLVKPLAWLGIFLCISTWILDLTGLVYPCPYCQVQRTAMGIVGIILLLPYQNLATYYLTLVFGVFGAHVAATQMFNNFHKSAYHEEFIYLSTCAFLILVAQLWVTFKRTARSQDVG